jgi:hypothetical protein
MKKNITKNIQKKNIQKNNKRKTMKGGINGSPKHLAMEFVNSILPKPIHITPPKPKASPGKHNNKNKTPAKKK